VKLGQLITGLLGLGLLGYGACTRDEGQPERPHSCTFASEPKLLSCDHEACLLCTADHVCRWLRRWNDCD